MNKEVSYHERSVQDMIYQSYLSVCLFGATMVFLFSICYFLSS
jgi:hypothetical protein